MSSRRAVDYTTLTPTATADGASLASNTFPFCIKGSSATELNIIWEVSISGQAPSSSSPTFMILSYDSTVGTGALTQGAGGNDVNLNPSSASTTRSGNTFATTAPQRTLAGHILNCSLNAFGGVYFWRANRLEEAPAVLGNANASGNNQGGEASLSAFTGGTTGLIGSHMIYETL